MAHLRLCSSETEWAKLVHEILVLMAHTQMPLINSHANVSSKARGLSLYLHLLLEYVSRSVHMLFDHDWLSLMMLKMSPDLIA